MWKTSFTFSLEGKTFGNSSAPDKAAVLLSAKKELWHSVAILEI